MNPRRIIIIAIIVLAAIGYGVFSYATRPIEVTSDIQSDVERLPESQATDSSSQKVLSIVPAESKAEFTLNEVLDGKATVVLGTTDQVAGDIQVTQSPAKLTIGEIKIDARTLKTDNDNRNGAIARMILESEKTGNEYIAFETTGINSLPATIETGKEFSYTITGNLTIKGVTKPVTFDAESTLNADGSLAGSASTVVTYGDYGISVPDFPFLANVDKTVKLSISLTAK